MRRLFLATIVLGCSAREQHAPTPVVHAPIFGDDRVADVLSRDAARAPRTFVEHEAQFGVGRACMARETYVIEEPATRFAEVIIPRSTISPRAIVTGCNPRPESLDGVTVSFGLFTVLPTDPARSAEDPLTPGPVEAMALDRSTGMYSFYVFDESGVQRIVRDRSGAVSTILGGRDGSVSMRAESGKRCFGCHVHGGPLMAALADPWTSWVSTRNPRVLGSYTDETANITKSVAPANTLEGVMRNAIRAFVVGGKSGQGLVARTLAGEEPGGLPLLLRSVFCETELQFASASATVPVQLVVDPAAAAGSSITRPTAWPGDDFPQLLPIRSEIDLRIEEALVARGVLGASTVRAIRLLDDTNDIFSDSRCAVLPRVLEGLPTDLPRIDAHVRAIVRAALPSDATYARALLDDREDGRDAYLTALSAGFDREIANRPLLEARLASRRAAARAMFPGNAHPLPFALVAP